MSRYHSASVSSTVHALFEAAFKAAAVEHGLAKGHQQMAYDRSENKLHWELPIEAPAPVQQIDAADETRKDPIPSQDELLRDETEKPEQPDPREGHAMPPAPEPGEATSNEAQDGQTEPAQTTGEPEIPVPVPEGGLLQGQSAAVLATEEHDTPSAAQA